MLSHFENFERDTIPCGFKDTVNSLEKQAFIVKDSVLLIDDYYPSQSLQESRKMEELQLLKKDRNMIERKINNESIF